MPASVTLRELVIAARRPGRRQNTGMAGKLLFLCVAQYRFAQLMSIDKCKHYQCTTQLHYSCFGHGSRVQA
jgi:hypothetical protein